MRFAEDGPDGFPIEVPDQCSNAGNLDGHGEHVDHSENRALLRGSPLDVARWLLCSEGWLHDAWALDEYVSRLRSNLDRIVEVAEDAADWIAEDACYPAPDMAALRSAVVAAKEVEPEWVAADRFELGDR